MAAGDTRPGGREAQLRALRALGGPGRVELAFRMSEEARRIAIAGLRSRQPELSEAEARARILRRILGPDLFDAAYPDATP